VTIGTVTIRSDARRDTSAWSRFSRQLRPRIPAARHHPLPRHGYPPQRSCNAAPQP